MLTGKSVNGQTDGSRSRAGRILWLVALVPALILVGCAADGSQSSTAPDGSGAAATSDSGNTVNPTAEGDVAQDLKAPWSMLRFPGGDSESTALLSERDSGEILALNPQTGATRTLTRVPDLETAGEGGLMGLAASNDGATVFAMYTAGDGNRVVRMSWDGTELGEPEVILSGIPRAQFHDGGRLAMAEDGNLFVATGDAGDPDSAQDMDSLSGKILRITETGDVPQDNPFGDSPVYSWGHRNVQGLAFDDAGRLWASEFGSSEYDELNLIEPGGNYGWPVVEGPSDNADFISPQAWWSPTSTSSPSGIAYADGNIWVAALRGEVLWQVPVSDGQAGRPVPRFKDEFGRLRDVVVGPEGSLWVLTNNTDGRGVSQSGDDRIISVKLTPEPSPDSVAE